MAVLSTLSQATQSPTSGSQVIGPAQSATSAATYGSTAATAAPPQPSTDMRVRLAALDPTLYSSAGSILFPLSRTNGMLFPYTPSVNFSQTVDYMNLQLVHSDTDYQAYTRTPSVKVTVSGKFTVQNQAEGIYVLAAVHFLRAASKSYFGEKDAVAGTAGLPPPVLLLSGYGNYMFGMQGSGGLRVILTSHSWTFDDTVDMVALTVPGGTVKLPSLFTIQTELMVIQTPQRMRKQFSFNDFASGALMKGSNNGWI